MSSHQMPHHRIGLAASLALLVGLLPGVLGAEEVGSPSEAVRKADALVEKGHPEEAIDLLEAWTRDHPDDHLAAQSLLAAKVRVKENQIQRLLAEEATLKGMVAGDLDYERAKARTDRQVQMRLAYPEYFLAQGQFGDAAAMCNAILHDYPNNEAVLCLKYRILEVLVARERQDLVNDQSYHSGEAVNDVIREGTFPREPPKIPRTEWIFAEDIEAAERQQVLDKLNKHIQALIYDGTDGTQSATVRELLSALFSYTGINYVLLDDALGNDKLTIHLVDVTVGDALATIAKMVKVRFNYSGNTVYVTSQDSEVMETRIIHLQSGLTDVDTELQLVNIDTSVPGTNSQPGIVPPVNGGQPPGLPPQANQGNRRPGQQQGQQGQNGQQKATSDLEKLLDQAPKLIVGWPDQGAFIHLDRKSNTLYVKSTPSTINELERLIHALDYNNVQVLIEARFVEVSDSAQKELGVDWQGGGTRGPLSIGGSGLVGAGGAPNPSAQGASINGTAVSLPGSVTPPTNGLFATALFNRGASIAATITALEQSNQANTLSDPKILALNNSVGVISVTQNINYIASYTSEPVNSNPVVSNGVTVENTSYVEQPQLSSASLGFYLRIKPSIARNSDIITLSVQPTVKELVKFDTFNFPAPTGNGGTINEPMQAPEIDTRSLVATLHVQNGQTVALGGLTRESDARGSAGVPFFSRVPIFGQLFRHDSKNLSRDNLIILITAYIVDPSGSKYSDEVQRMQDSAKVLLPPVSLDALVGTNPNGQPPSQLPSHPGR